MASLNELINLSQYQSGDMGRERLPVIQRATPQEQMRQSLVIQSLAAEAQRRREEAAIAARQRQLWESVGKVQNKDKTKAGIAEQVVDKEEAGGRDIVPVGDYENNSEENISNYDGQQGYEAKISPSGRMVLAKPVVDKEKKYDKIKVIDKAKKLMSNEYQLNGIDIKELSASEVGKNLRKYMQQVEQDDYGKVYTQSPKENINPTGVTSSPEDFLPQEKNALKEKRGMIEVAKDFYFPKKNKQSASDGKVMIQTPDGKRGYIPQANLQKAIQRGAKLVQ
jgi:hypothetical protein